MQRVVRHLALMVAEGSLRSVRFSPGRLTKVLEANLHLLAPRAQDTQLERLSDACIPELATAHVLDRMSAALQAAARDSSSSKADRIAADFAATAVLLCRHGLQSAEDSPLLRLVFEAQIADLIDDVHGRMVTGNTPPILRPDEFLWITCAMRHVGSAENLARDPARARRLTTLAMREAMDDALVAQILDRLRDAIGASTPKKLCGEIAAMAVAFALEPAGTATASLLSPSGAVLVGDGEEPFLDALDAAPEWTAADLEPYRRHLDAGRDRVAALRVRRCQEMLAAG